jgi:hypothetical protein
LAVMLAVNLAVARSLAPFRDCAVNSLRAAEHH